LAEGGRAERGDLSSGGLLGRGESRKALTVANALMDYSGVWPWLYGLLGMTWSRSNSILVTPSRLLEVAR